MFKIIVFLAFAVATSYGGPTPTAGTGTYCGQTPTEVFKCIDMPNVIGDNLSKKCNEESTEREKMTCLFREHKWFAGSAVDFEKVNAHFDKFATDHPEWSPAVQQAKTACFVPNLPPQGVYLNSPAFDILHCVMTSFIKHATPAQWSTASECTYPRAFAAACPVCPNSCFGLLIPAGSCNACLSLPRTP